MNKSPPSLPLVLGFDSKNLNLTEPKQFGLNWISIRFDFLEIRIFRSGVDMKHLIFNCPRCFFINDIYSFIFKQVIVESFHSKAINKGVHVNPKAVIHFQRQGTKHYITEYNKRLVEKTQPAGHCLSSQSIHGCRQLIPPPLLKISSKSES